MTGNVTVSINPLPTAYNVTGGGAYLFRRDRHACRSEPPSQELTISFSSMVSEVRQTREQVHP